MKKREWYFLKDKSPQLNKLVSVKIVVNGEERFYIDQLVCVSNGIYKWAYNYYGDAEIAWAYR